MAVVSPVAYSASAILGKNLLTALRPHDMLFWRFAIATPVLWLVVAGRAARGGPRAGSVSYAPNIGLGFLFGFMSLTGFIALRHMDASIYIVLIYFYVALVAAASPLFGHRVRPAVWLALAATVIGIVLTVPGALEGSAQGNWFGLGLTLLQAVLLATYTLLGSRVVAVHSDGIVTMGWSLVGSWIGMALLAALLGLRVPDDPVTVAQLLAFAIVPTIIGGLAFYQALRTVPPHHGGDDRHHRTGADGRVGHAPPRRTSLAGTDPGRRAGRRRSCVGPASLVGRGHPGRRPALTG